MIAGNFRWCSIMFAAIAACSLSGAAMAQGNLLENPEFENDLSGWDNLSDPPAVWSELDASNSPLSGSALMQNDFMGNGGTSYGVRQCIPVTGSHEYTFGGQVLVPANQPVGAYAQFLVFSFSSADCSGQALQILGSGGSDLDSWVLQSMDMITDSEANSLLFSFGILKPSGMNDTIFAHFDNPFLYASETGAYRIIDEKLSGVWYNPATDGQGVYLDISPQANVLAGGWFTWSKTPGVIDWMTLQGGFDGVLATLSIYRSSGGKFNDPTAVNTVPIGIAELRFASCTEGELSFKFDGETGFTVIPMVRITPAFKGCKD